MKELEKESGKEKELKEVDDKHADELYGLNNGDLLFSIRG
jgi:hypothetical protein